jgi:plastocyanin
MKKVWFRTSVAALSLTLIALTSCARERSGDVHQGAGGADAVNVVMHDDEFDPDGLQLEAGTEVQVEVRNEGSQGHNFTIDALSLSTGTVEPGQVVTATFTVPNGTTGYQCTFHPGMTGEIVAG